MYRGTSLTRTRTPLGPYHTPMPRVLRGSWGGGRFLMGEAPPVDPEGHWRLSDGACPRRTGGFNVDTFIIYKLYFNQNYYTFALMSLIKIALHGKLH